VTWEWIPPVVLGALLSMAYPWGKRLLQHWRRPVLEFVLPEHESERYITLPLADGKGDGRFVAVKVRNCGRSAATGCYVRLLALFRRETEGDWRRVIEIRDPEMVPWANRGLERGYACETVETDIPLTISLCVCRSVEPKAVLFQIREAGEIDGRQFADGRQRAFAEGEYRVLLRVYSDNAKAATGCFDIANGYTVQALTISAVQREQADALLARYSLGSVSESQRR